MWIFRLADIDSPSTHVGISAEELSANTTVKEYARERYFQWKEVDGFQGKFEGVVIGDEHTGPDKVEYVCSWCSRSLVRLTDRNNQSESWFCRNCSIEFNSDDERVSHKQRLSIPYQEDSEPAVASIGTVPDVSIHHEPTLKGGFAALAKKGTIKFTSYQTTERQ